LLALPVGTAQPGLDCNEAYECLDEHAQDIVRQLLVQTPSHVQLLQHQVQQGGCSSSSLSDNMTAAEAKWAVKVNALMPVVRQVLPRCLVQQQPLVLLASGEQLHGCSIYVR
jgi:hypothetical protein